MYSIKTWLLSFLLAISLLAHKIDGYEEAYIASSDGTTIKLAPGDQMYCKAGTTLYNQDEAKSNSDFYIRPLNYQQDLLEKHFHDKRFYAYLDALKSRGINAGPFFIFMATLYCLRNRLPDVPNYIGFGGAMAFQDYLGPAVKEGFNSASLIVNMLKQRFNLEETSDPFEKHQIEYVRNKSQIPLSYQEAIERIFIESKCEPRFDDKVYKQKIKMLLDLPTQNKEIIYDENVINKAFLGYSPEAELDLKRFCIRHVAACTENNVRKIAAYFKGEPGVGKTRAAHQMGQALTVPLKKVSLAEIDIEDLVGTRDKPGLLLSILCENQGKEKNFKNMLLLMDDADRILLADGQQFGRFSSGMLLSFLLTLLEPETKTFYSPFLDLEVDISSLGIILAGNTDITDAALASRLQIIEFSNYESEYKKQIVWEELFPSMLATHKKAKLQLTEQDFTQEDTDAINALVEKDEDPGFRSIKLKLTKYIEDKVLSKYFMKNTHKRASLETT